jgi:hypothetical protein
LARLLHALLRLLAAPDLKRDTALEPA